MSVRVKLRPGTHFVPSPKGVHCTRAGDSFLLAGPPALYRLIDSRLGDLLDGTTVDELVTATAESMRPALAAVVSALLGRGALFAVTAPPSPADADRYADVLAYAEEHCPDPHAAFARLRQTQVQVMGNGPAADSVRRGLNANGLRTTESKADIVVLTNPGAELVLPANRNADHVGPTNPDADPAMPTNRNADLVVLTNPDAFPAVPTNPNAELVVLTDPDAPSPPAGVPVLPVLCGPDSAVVGPVITEPDRLAPVLAAAERAAQWQRTHPGSAAPMPIGAVLAGSLAARRIVDHILRPGADSLIVVHGPAADTTEVPLPGQGEAPLASTTAVPPPGEDETPLPSTTAVPPPGEDETPLTGQSKFALPRRSEAADLTTPWRGWAWPLPDPAPALPLKVAAFQPVDGTPVVYGWGSTQAAAEHDARLRLVRARASAECPAGWVGAAGRDEAEWRLDGMLRLIGTDLLRHASGTAASKGQPHDDRDTPTPNAQPDHDRDTSTDNGLPDHDTGTPTGGGLLRHRPGTPIGNGQPGHDRGTPADDGLLTPAARAVAAALRDYFERPVRLRLHRAPGLDWVLATADDGTGEPLAAEWAAEPATALYAVLMAALVRLHLSDPPPLEPGTWSIGRTPVAAIVAASAARDVTGERRAHDPAIGVLPLVGGPIGLR